MLFKTNDTYKNQRLELLMQAVGNDRLEGELCPNCFELYSAPALRQISHSVLKPSIVGQIGKGKIRQALERMKEFKKDSVLKRSGSDELIKEYTCSRCGHSFVGELNLITNLSETRVLSFFGYDESKSYKEDFYSFSLIDDSYDSFIQKLWNEEVEPTVDEPPITPLMIRETTEDAITGEVLGMLKRFFINFTREVYSDIGATVRVYTSYQAGTVESGRREGVPASGADSAIWVGPMTKEDAQLVNDYVNQMPDSKLPVLVGNGVIFQAKKENGGKIDRKQIEDLIKYASIEHKDHEYLGVPGKLFMNYSMSPPFVTVLSCDYSYNLYMYSNSLPADQKSISFPMTLTRFSAHTAPIALPEFVQSYLSGKIGTPLLMLQDIFATPGPKLIVGLPPESLTKNSPAGQPLSSVADGWIEALGQMLESIEKSEANAQWQPEEQEPFEAYLGNAHQRTQPQKQQQRQVELKQMRNQS